MDICHNDGVKTNNHLSNLRVDSRRNNHADKHRHGTMTNGERNGLAKLTTEDVKEIRKRREQGEPFKSIAADSNVRPETVRNAARRITWKHIA
jgi:DNA-binding NarL/FixJ family response regulator